MMSTISTTASRYGIREKRTSASAIVFRKIARSTPPNRTNSASDSKTTSKTATVTSNAMKKYRATPSGFARTVPLRARPFSPPLNRSRARLR